MNADGVTKILSLCNLNPHIIKMEYAVRGPVALRANEIERELQNGKKKLFTRVIKTNIGDGHAVGMPPITFFRQVLAVLSYPKLLEDTQIPRDVKSRAKEILGVCLGNSVGSYTDSLGIKLVRQHCAEFIEKRDGFPADWNNIVLSAGASAMITYLMELFVIEENGKNTGVMVPVPQYPLYSACIAEFGMHFSGYYLDEDNDWALDMLELERSLSEAKCRCNPRILVVINPGNPTGQVLSEKNIRDIITFAHKNRLFIFADEVYQDNIYNPRKKFHSFKKMSCEMGPPFSEMEMASFMSASKGYMGECGLRGAFTEVVNLSPEMMMMLRKSLSARISPSTLGQALMDLVAKSPQPGEESYDLFVSEKNATLGSLAERSAMVYKAFSGIEGYSCNMTEGAMYSFPRIHLPQKAIDEASARSMHPDEFYAFQLLENTGVCIVPGSGFGQKPGTYHFRTTILPPPDLLKEMVCKVERFHKEFIMKYK